MVAQVIIETSKYVQGILVSSAAFDDDTLLIKIINIRLKFLILFFIQPEE